VTPVREGRCDPASPRPQPWPRADGSQGGSGRGQDLTGALVRIPSRAGIDPYDPIVDLLSGWMREQGLTTTVLRDGTGAIVGLTTEIRSAYPGPRWVLDACLDSAPFGDEAAWTHPPTSGVVEEGWMWGGYAVRACRSLGVPASGQPNADLHRHPGPPPAPRPNRSTALVACLSHFVPRSAHRPPIQRG
jgi:hypothetical protein